MSIDVDASDVAGDAACRVPGAAEFSVWVGVDLKGIDLEARDASKSRM